MTRHCRIHALLMCGLLVVTAAPATASLPPVGTAAGTAGATATAEPTPQSGGEVTFALDNDGTGFNTTQAIAPGSIRLITAMMDALVAATPGGGWAPNLAESITSNADATVWTITMRPNVTFHDGVPADAAALVANLEAFRTSPLTGYAYTFVKEVVATGPLTAEVRMNQPWAAYPYSLIGQSGWLVSPATIGQNDTFVGTGPFILETWTPGDSARLVRNPHYWRAGRPYLDAINIKFIPDTTVRRQAYDAGDVQGYINPSDTDILELRDRADTYVPLGADAPANEYLLLLNCAQAPLDDLRVRRALALAIDRDLYIKNLDEGLTTKASSFIDLNSPFAATTDYPDYDPDEAKRLIDEYEAEKGPISLNIKLEPNPSVHEQVDLIASFWQDAGVDVSITDIGVGQSAATAIADDFQVFSWYQFSSPDPDGEYPFFHSGGGANVLNWTNFVDPKIDEAFDIGRRSLDRAERADAYKQVQEELASQVPIIWINHLNGVEGAVVSTKLHHIGGERLLPDGTKALGMVSGSFFAWTDVWLER